jgi:two-component system, chemotaxis family, sensor kinase CheA
MDDDILQEFLAESWENLARLDTEIVSLEKDPANSDLIASIFRTIHTIKGTCGFIGLNRLGKVAHSTENVLGKMRDKTLDVSPAAISLVLDGIDRIKHLLEGLEATKEEPAVDSEELINKLELLASLAGDAPVAAVPHTAPPAVSQAPAIPVPPQPVATPPAPVIEQPAPPPVEHFEANVAPATSDHHQNSAPSIAPKGAAEDADPAGGDSKKSVADLSIRVNVDVLDRLMNLVGELVLTRNQLLQMVRGEDESKYSAPITHLNRVTTDLQEGVMKTRMQPIGNAWSKLPRLVRDLAQLTGKQIELEMSGAETELDRTVLDAIKDPLTHMVRNSADHGIERADIRQRNGKPEAGRVKLNAFHEGGHVIICIEDDGAGISRDRVLKKAIEQGLVSEAEGSQLSDGEIFKFIFRAGFSTAEKVSSVSGRGVGMDVVRTAIERIGGTVELNSIAGHGTTVRIKIPLTLAIISALVVESGSECFAIPQLGVVELVRVAREDRHKIEKIHDNEVFRLRDRLLPLVHLNDILKLPEVDSSRGDVNIVVVQVGEEQFGLIVSEVFDTQEIVVKPMGSLLKEIKIYQGTTILGDGRVIMILDVGGIASQFGGMASRTRELERHRQDLEGASDLGEPTSLLIFATASGDPMAVPLALVARLEEVPVSSIERSGDRLLMQYRGDLLPLMPLHGEQPHLGDRELQPIVVFSEGRHSMGLMVDQIQDIIEEPLSVRMQSSRPGVLGTAIINGKATDLVDTQHYLMKANPLWFQREGTKRRPRVLIVDDSLFFRQLVRTAVEADGYRAVAVEGPSYAIEMIERGEKFDIILSDIEMPLMDGCEFAQWCRKRPQLTSVPLVAITSLAGDIHEQRILRAGFDHLLMKFNPQQLSSTLKELCAAQTQPVGVSA